MLELFGRMGFLSHYDNVTQYIKFNFTQPSQTGQYRKLELSAPDMGEMDVLVFSRDVQFSDPVTESGSRGHCGGNGCLFVCLIVSALTFILAGSFK